MNENNTLFDAAIVENGIITNVLVFDNEDTMREFGAFLLAEGQGIGDMYMTPEEYKAEQQKRAFNYLVSNEINRV